MKKYQNELLHIIAEHAVNTMDIKSIKQAIWDDKFGEASGWSDKELEQYCEEAQIDYKPYINTGEDI